jgi:hypothetical protein
MNIKFGMATPLLLTNMGGAGNGGGKFPPGNRPTATGAPSPDGPGKKSVSHFVPFNVTGSYTDALYVAQTLLGISPLNPMPAQPIDLKLNPKTDQWEV